MASEAVEPSSSYSGLLSFWVDFDDWSKTDEYGFPGTGTRFIRNRSYIDKLLREARRKQISLDYQKEEFGGGLGLGQQDSYPKSGQGGDWRVRALVKGGAPTAEAAEPVLNAIATVLGFFTLPVAATGSGAQLSLGSAKGVRVLFKNPDDLIKASRRVKNGKSGRIREVEGNADEIFESLTRGVTNKTSSGSFKLDDGTILRKYISSSEGVPTIHIHKSSGRIHKSSGRIYKIRIK